MKPTDVHVCRCIEYGVECSDKDPKLKVGDHRVISRYKNILVKSYTANWFQEVFVIKEIKHFVLYTYVISDLNGDKIVGTFYVKELQKARQKEFRIDKAIKIKGDKLYVKWKGYDCSFDNWINMKDTL